MTLHHKILCASVANMNRSCCCSRSPFHSGRRSPHACAQPRLAAWWIPVYT